MNIYIKQIFSLWLLVTSTSTYAELISLDFDTSIGSYAVDINGTAVALDTNPVTGEYAVCYRSGIIEITCMRMDNDNTVLTTVVKQGIDVDGMHVDVAINDDSDMYVLWTGSNGAGQSVFVQGFDSNGDALFNAVEETEADTSTWDDLSLVLTPSNFWIVGSYRLITSDEVSLQSYYAIHDRSNGGFVLNRLFGSLVNDIYGLVSCGPVIDAAVSRTGDVILARTEPNLPITATEGVCAGSVFAETIRENGDNISNSVQLSDSITDPDDGSDLSNFHDPATIAYENGEYVVAWRDTDNAIYAANLQLDGSIVTQSSLVGVGGDVRVGGNAATQDYVVLGYDDANNDCGVNGRLALDADISPSVTFNIFTGVCHWDRQIQFVSDGSIILVRASNDELNGDILVYRIGLPAELEISSTSILEGDPQRGQGTLATVEVTINRPQPDGEAIEVSYFPRDDTALAGIDYTPVQGTLRFVSGGEQSQSIFIPIISDTEFEDNELFSMVIEDADNAVIRNGGDTGTVLIINDDSSPDISFSCGIGGSGSCPDNVDEPAPGETVDLFITLTMAEAIDRIVTVNYDTVDGTATAGDDYQAASGSVQFLPGGTEATIVLTVFGDTINENTETFILELSGADTVSLIETSITFSIINENLCNLDLDPDPNEVVLDSAGLINGQTPSFTVNSTQTSCLWDISTDSDWITITNPSTGSGTGTATVDFTADPYDPAPGEPQARNGSIMVTLNDTLVTQDPLVFMVGQDGDCDFTLSMDSADFPVDGGSGSFTVMPSDETCEWAGTSSVEWVTVTSPLEIATGTGVLEFTVSDNAGETNVENPARSFTLISDEFDYTINQDGCSYSLEQSTINVTADEDDNVPVNVLAPGSDPGACSWTATSQDSWIIIADGASGSGGGTVTLAVLDNPSVEGRTGTVLIGDEILTVNQNAQECSFDVDPASLGLCPDGELFALNVAATDGCTWQLVEEQDWLEILTNGAGEGDETATVQAQSNLSESPRNGTMQLLVSLENLPLIDIDLVQEGFLIYEPFETGLPVDWLFDPDGDWTVVDDQLIGFLLGNGMGTAIDMSNACTDCKIESTVTVTTASNGSMDVLTMVGWYQDDTSFVGLAMDEFANTWRLFQTVGGETTMVEAPVVSIVPNTPYDLTLGFDGVNFFAEIDGVELLELEAMFSEPLGYAGFMVNDNNAQFSELRVTGTATPAGETDILLDDSFEEVIPLMPSMCTQ